MRDKIASDDQPVTPKTLSNEAVWPTAGEEAGIAKSRRYYANFTIRDLVCISMGYIFGFETRGGVGRERRTFLEKGARRRRREIGT